MRGLKRPGKQPSARPSFESGDLKSWPFLASGVVASINGTVGQWINGGGASSNASAAGAFMALVDLSTPQVSAQVSEADIGRLHAGQAATFTVSAYPGHMFNGTVETIEPSGQTTSNVVTYDVLVSTVADERQLLPGMTATVAIVTEEHDDAVLVPNTSIAYARAKAPDRGSLYVLRGTSEIATPVTLGSTDGQDTEVLDGLQPGDQVVIADTSAAPTGANSSSGVSDNSRPPAA